MDTIYWSTAKGVSIQVKDFAQYIEKNDVCLVTVNNSKYWTYRYEGNFSSSFILSKGLIIYRNNVKKDNIQWIYDCAKNNVHIDAVLKL